jgi:glycosyltransferase involved in cell wall biosynthesis
MRKQQVSLMPVDIAINGRFLTQPITGVQRYGHELLLALDKVLKRLPDTRATLFCPKFEGALPRLENINIVQGGRFNGHAWEQIDLPRMTRGKILFCPGNTAPALSLISGQQVVACVHDLSYLYFPTAYSRGFRLFYNAIIPLIFRRAKAVITVSESERRSISKHYPFVEKRLFAIQNGGLSEDLKPDSGTRDEHAKKYVLYVGSLSKRKNFPNMFEVACRLAREKSYNFVFVGGTAAGLTSSGLSIPPDVADKITFAGQINETEALIKFYSNATVLMFPSFYEASPLPPIEAMSCGCPVISSAIPSLEERCGDAALYCDPSDVDNIAERVVEVMETPALQQDLRARGLARTELFTWENCALQTIKVINASTSKATSLA